MEAKPVLIAPLPLLPIYKGLPGATLLAEILLQKDVLDCDYVQVDETTLPVINKEIKKAKKEYLWIVRSVMKNSFFFHYDSGSRSGKVALDLLTNFRGY